MAAPALPPARYAPIVVHDRQERAPLSAVEAVTVPVPGVRRPATSAAPRGGGPAATPTAYVRVRGRVLQFWLFYRDNPQDRGIVHTGRHEGDWELVQVELGPDGAPRSVLASQHSGAERCGWDAVEREGTHPVVYVANGSHANYFAVGTRDRTWPDPNDEADGRGVRSSPAVVTVSGRRPAWMAWPGRWGASRAGVVPGESDSPRGPSHQPARWDDPAAISASACHAAAEPVNRTEWILVAVVVALVAAAGLVARRVRRTAAGSVLPPD